MSTSTLRALSTHAAQREKAQHAIMVETLSVYELSHRSKEETSRYLRGEPYTDRYSFELFSRAVVHRDDDAWGAVYEQYSDLVRHWLNAVPDEAGEDISVTFARFWQAVDAEKFHRFNSLSAILQYLKMCAHAVRIDRIRGKRARSYEAPLDSAAHTVPSDENVEEITVARLDGAALWDEVQAALPDDRERLIVRLSFIAGLTPRDICARYGMEFSDVTEVYRVKRNVLERLGRIAEIKALR